MACSPQKGSETIIVSESVKVTEEYLVESEPILTDITLWTFPVGDFGKEDVVAGFLESFHEINPHINVHVEILDYATGDQRIEEAIASRKAPDIVMEGPERLVANWGARGLMIDIRDMWDEETTANIKAVSENVVSACGAPDGAYYEYPMVMTTHVMAINYEIFEKADALQYLDEETRSWTTEGFIAAMEAVRDSGLVETPGIIYSGGQGGDQGTRALVTNLYEASFTDLDHTFYTINEAEGVRGLNLLVDMVENGSMSHDSNIAAADELKLFAEQSTAISLAWNATNELIYEDQIEFTPFAMNFPSEDGNAQLQGGIWGFGVFNNGDMNKVNAAKTLIEFLVDDPIQSKKSIVATNFFPTNQVNERIYIGTENENKMRQYMSFLPNLGSYYQVTPAWPEQRIAWYNLLQQVFSGRDVQEATNAYVEVLNTQINP